MSSKADDPAFALRENLLANLRDGRWRPGQKLPTERRLGELHGISRSTVRRVLNALKGLGLITQKAGSGTYVAEDVTEKLPHAARTELRLSPADVMEARLVFEPGLIDLVVRNGTPADFAQLATCCSNADASDTLEQFERWDVAFHNKLSEATHNSVVVRISELISTMRDQGEWGLLKKRSATPERRAAYRQEHWSVLAALRQRDAVSAKQSLVDHLRHVRRNMFDDRAASDVELEHPVRGSGSMVGLQD